MCMHTASVFARLQSLAKSERQHENALFVSLRDKPTAARKLFEK